MRGAQPIVRFFNGRLNLDDSLRTVPKEDFIWALNIVRDQGAGNTFNDDTVPGKVRGNRLVANPFLPAGRNKCIGCKPDTLRNVAYFFIWNENGDDCVFRYNNSSRTIDLVLQEPDQPEPPNPPVPLTFDFDEHKKIIHIDIIHRDEGDIISWTDALNSPKEFNVNTAIAGGLSPLYEFVEAAKRPPKIVPFGQYISDGNVKVNNMKGKLFEFAYRYVYSDFQKSTFSYLSASPLPNNDYIANLNPLSNNGINVSINTGSANVKNIEVAMRYSIGNVYSDYYLINSINKSVLGLSDLSPYAFNFYNNAVYPAIDPDESGQLFDYVPRRANAQCQPNGNHRVYGGILEGYDPLSQSEMNVLMNVTYEEIELPEGEIIIGSPEFNFTVVNPGLTFNCTIGGTVTAGDIYTFKYFRGVSPGNGQIDYTAMLGDSAADVAAYFVAQITALSGMSATDTGGGTFQAIFGGIVPGSITTQAIPATAPGGGGFYDRIYKFGAKYRFGIVYFDEQGRTNGVMTYVLESGSLNDFEVETEEFNALDTAYKRPVIEMVIQHLPPQWAKSYSIVRTRDLIASSYFFWKCDAFATGSGFFYIGVDNLTAYQTDNPNWTASWSFEAGDRLRGHYQFLGSSPTGWGAIYSPVLDYEVIGVVDYDFGSGNQRAIKVRAYPGTISPGNYDDRLVFQVYRPAQKTSQNQQLYYEFGETYDTEEIDGVWYHFNQTALSNPTIQFRDGDSYIRIRPGTGDEYLILDPNFSEYQPSALDSNGRAFIVDENAAETYNPALVRFSEAFQFGTNINGLNRFYFENFDEYNISYGDILKLDTYGPYMKVGQMFRIGNVPVFNQIIRTQSGSDAITTSDRLLNTIYYYDGDFGVGSSPESWARNNFASYFIDNIRGVVCRLSQDGITPLSILYKINSFATAKFPLRTGNSKIYGVFNADINRYEFSMELAGEDPAFTMAFDEPGNAFEGERSYQPEMWCCLGTLLISFKDGQLYTHDSTIYNEFYGVKYSSIITGVFNDLPLIKKVFNCGGYRAQEKWTSEVTGDIYTSYLNSQTGLQQISNLKDFDIEFDEGVWLASLKRDANSMADAAVAIHEGDYLMGDYLVWKFTTSGDNFNYLHAPYLLWSVTNKNF
jgi:hypothetical protein